MKCSQALVVLAAGLGLSACATAAVPVAAVPGPNKDAATFQKDEAACRAEAGRAAYPAAGATTSGQGARASGGTEGAWGAYFAAYSQCEASRGNPVQPVPWSVYTGYPPAYGYAAAYGYPYYGWGYPYYGWGYPWGAYPGFYPGFVAFYGGFGYGFPWRLPWWPALGRIAFWGFGAAAWRRRELGKHDAAVIRRAVFRFVACV